MPSRTLIAAAIGIPLLVGTVFVVKASSSDSEAPAAAATSVEKPGKKAAPRPPSAKLPEPRLPRLHRDPSEEPPPPPPTPAAVPTAPSGDTETVKMREPAVSPADREKRLEIARQHGRTPEPSRTNPGVVDSATQAEIAAKADILRKRALMDKFACNAPESKERLELLSPEERAKWEIRCGTANRATNTPKVR